jgi:hypothetical protein
MFGPAFSLDAVADQDRDALCFQIAFAQPDVQFSMARNELPSQNLNALKSGPNGSPRVGGAFVHEAMRGVIRLQLNAQGIKTVRGGEWSLVQLQRVLSRLATELR